MAISDGGVVELSRALRETADNPLLRLIQTYVGPAILVVQQIVNNALDNLANLVNELKSSDLYALITFVLATFNISLDNVTSIITEIQADLNEVFAFFTGTDLSS